MNAAKIKPKTVIAGLVGVVAGGTILFFGVNFFLNLIDSTPRMIGESISIGAAEPEEGTEEETQEESTGETVYREPGNTAVAVGKAKARISDLNIHMDDFILMYQGERAKQILENSFAECRKDSLCQNNRQWLAAQVNAKARNVKNLLTSPSVDVEGNEITLDRFTISQGHYDELRSAYEDYRLFSLAWQLSFQNEPVVAEKALATSQSVGLVSEVEAAIQATQGDL